MSKCKSKRNWTPVLDGDIYCSPACGFNCTLAKHDEAVAGANALVEELGTDWFPRVWENGNWYYSAKHKREDIEVVGDYRSNGYLRCYYNGPVQQLGKGETATEAFLDAVGKMIKFSESVIESLENINGR